jgi:small neutral amino acid transporter SnatA (MarC family)
MSSKIRFLGGGIGAVRLAGGFLVLISALRTPLGATISGKS